MMLNLFFLYLFTALFLITNVRLFLYIIYTPMGFLNKLKYYLYKLYKNHPNNQTGYY